MSDGRQILVDALKPDLIERAENKCELCSCETDFDVYEVPPVINPELDKSALLCRDCISKISESSLDVNHWLCLNESAWTQVPAVQVLVIRLLDKLRSESWALDLLDQIYVEDDVRKWADDYVEEGGAVVKDCNGTLLSEGDIVAIIKDLDVKGTGFTAKRGTIVRGIHLGSNPDLVEGKVNGVTIFLRAEFLKKS